MMCWNFYFFSFFNFFILSPIVTAGPNEILFYFILFFFEFNSRGYPRLEARDTRQGGSRAVEVGVIPLLPNMGLVLI